LIVAALFVAACGSDSEDGAWAGDCTVRLGAAISETGNFAREGQWNQRGYDIWLDWVNGEGGGIQVGDQSCNAEIIYYDDESDPDTSARLYEKLISEDQVDFLLGPYSSGITLGTSAIAERYGVIMVEAHGASEALFERGFENLFAVLTPASYYTESALKALADSGAETVVIANRDETFSAAAADGAVQWANDYGMEVLARETYPPDSDLTAIMTKFRDLDPDVFVGAGHFNDSVLFVRMAQELGFTPNAMMLTVGPDSPEFVEELGADADYIYGDSQWDRSMGYEDEFFGTAAEFGQHYFDLYGEWPPYQVASCVAESGRGHLLRPDQLRRHRQEHRQADGDRPGPRRRGAGGGAHRRGGSRPGLPGARLRLRVRLRNADGVGRDELTGSITTHTGDRSPVTSVFPPRARER
jgi:branched-chain amino acid transport system substrate-binding protein